MAARGMGRSDGEVAGAALRVTRFRITVSRRAGSAPRRPKAHEMARKEDYRRKANGTLNGTATGAALGHPVSRVWAGYWQQ